MQTIHVSTSHPYDVLIGAGTHIIVNVFLYLAGLRKNMF